MEFKWINENEMILWLNCGVACQLKIIYIVRFLIDVDVYKISHLRDDVWISNEDVLKRGKVNGVLEWKW